MTSIYLFAVTNKKKENKLGGVVVKYGNKRGDFLCKFK